MASAAILGQTSRQIRSAPSLPMHQVKGEGGDLLHPANGHVIDVVVLAMLEKVVVDLTRAQHNTLQHQSPGSQSTPASSASQKRTLTCSRLLTISGFSSGIKRRKRVPADMSASVDLSKSSLVKKRAGEEPKAGLATHLQPGWRSRLLGVIMINGLRKSRWT